MEIRCLNCGYEWETKSELRFVTCPNCRLKTKNREKENESNKEISQTK